MCGDVSKFGDDVAAGRRVDGVRHGLAESQLGGDENRVETQCPAGECSGTVGRRGCTNPPVAETLKVAHQRPRVGKKMMRKKHGLGVLQVCASRHWGAFVRFGLRADRVDELQKKMADGCRVVQQIHTYQRRDLVVAAAASAQFSAERGSGDVDQSTFESEVHIFVALEREERTVKEVGKQFVERRQHTLELVVVEVSGRRQRAGVSLRARDVIGGELPIEVRGLRQTREFRRGSVAEPAAPEGSRAFFFRQARAPRVRPGQPSAGPGYGVCCYVVRGEEV
jgi:hypothetical protein